VGKVGAGNRANVAEGLLVTHKSLDEATHEIEERTSLTNRGDGMAAYHTSEVLEDRKLLPTSGAHCSWIWHGVPDRSR
jgi:hypothetical protein